MKLYLIRHGRTKGNSEGRYVGRTDEALLPGAVEELSGISASLKGVICPDALYVSPMRRCRESARILFPGKEQTVARGLRECDFGEFEYRNYVELNGNPDYQRFIDSGGTCGFPGGETLREFQGRCAEEFYRAVRREWEQGTRRNIVFVVHGGTIMAILDRFSHPHKDYFEWQAGNGRGYEAEVIFDRESGSLTLCSIMKFGEPTVSENGMERTEKTECP